MARISVILSTLILNSMFIVCGFGDTGIATGTDPGLLYLLQPFSTEGYCWISHTLSQSVPKICLLAIVWGLQKRQTQVSLSQAQTFPPPAYFPKLHGKGTWFHSVSIKQALMQKSNGVWSEVCVISQPTV